jgi:hypothetical protein
MDNIAAAYILERLKQRTRKINNEMIVQFQILKSEHVKKGNDTNKNFNSLSFIW